MGRATARVAVGTLLAAALLGTLGVPWRAGRGEGPDTELAESTLRAIASAQRAYRLWVHLDADGDGRGDHGPLSALSSVRPPVFGSSLLDVRPNAADQEVGARGGWMFQLYLPPNVDDAEREWWCAAWPAVPCEEGAVLLRNAHGATYAARDPHGTFAGRDGGPSFAALLAVERALGAVPRRVETVGPYELVWQVLP